MKTVKTIFTWIFCIFIFGWLIKCADDHDRKKEKICEDRGMIYVQPFQQKGYCAHGEKL